MAYATKGTRNVSVLDNDSFRTGYLKGTNAAWMTVTVGPGEAPNSIHGALPRLFSPEGRLRRRYAAAACRKVGPSPATVVRRMSRTWSASKRRTRCMVCRLSHITRSNGCQRCT